MAAKKGAAYIAHIRKDEQGEWKVQTLEEHIQGVSDLSANFADEFGLGVLGRLMGKLHDKGKEQKAFQEYIAAFSGYAEELKCKNSRNHTPEHVPHAYIGGLCAKELLGQAAFLIAYPILGHHRGLYDFVDYETVMNGNTIPDDIGKEKTGFDKTAALEPLKNLLKHPEEIHHLIRMLFSSLVDADWLDTEAFMQPETAALRRKEYDLNPLLGRLERHLAQINRKVTETQPKDNSIGKTHVNEIRKEIQGLCAEAAEKAPGIYSLTAPTGGGKTLSSMLWALRHAVKYGKHRIIIAIPYTSIIVQTAEVLTKIFGTENVLAHYSTNDFNSKSTYEGMDNSLADRLRLATENWDYPIIVTTNVQLFESLFSNKPSRCRKLHNICNSVLILDEVQTLPTTHLQPIVDALSVLQNTFGVSVLMTTASMPALTGSYGTKPAIFKGLREVHEIIPSERQLHKKLSRVKMEFIDSRENRNDYDSIAERLSQHERVLCIVNTRKDALQIYQRLQNVPGQCIHLSRLMCPKHIQDSIRRIRELLDDNEGGPVRVVATQLIEAGVDIDFPVVYRQIAGLDSLIQAAGRCNREGRLQTGHTFVFHLDTGTPSGFINYSTNATEALLSKDRQQDWFDPMVIKQYFEQLYGRCTEFDEPKVSENGKFPNLKFETMAEKFKLINDDAIQVTVPYSEDCRQIIGQIKQGNWDNPAIRRLSQYMVGLHKKDFQELFNAGIIEQLSEGLFYLADERQYDMQTGISLQNHYLEEIFIK